MGSHSDPDFGPPARADATGAPFSVTGPPSISLDSGRRAVASFVVTNTSGRPVIARLLPQGLEGTDAQWLSMVGDIERPLGVDATLTAEVEVEVPADAPSGQHAMRLDVAVEEAPDRVTVGQAVSFAVPDVAKKRFPAWILAVVVIALLVIAVGVWVILRLTGGPDDPVAQAPPTVVGTAEIGAELTVQNGTWDPADATLLHRWQVCPADDDPADPQQCTDITVTTESETAVAGGSSYVVGADQEGMRIRVVEVAVSGDLSDLEGADPSSLADLPQAAAASAMTDVVPPAPAELITVPNVIGLAYSDARTTLADQGLQVLRTMIGASDDCDPVVEAQSPAAPQQVELGAAVAVTTKQPPPLTECLTFPLPEFELPQLPEITFP